MGETSADVTIKDVASQSGVSPMTVSRVINGSERVRPETRRRVEEAITELGYVPSRLARGLSRRRTGTLAVIVPDVANPFFTAVVRGAEDVARRAEFRAILCDTRADLAVERDAIEELIAHRVEGIVIAPVSDRSKGHLERLARFGVPYVLVDRTVRDVEADAVVGDSAGGAQRLVEHLISLGHRRIGFIVESNEVSTARDRRRGYELALKAADIPVDPALLVETAVDPHGGADGMRRLLELDHPPTAVFTVNNLVAVGRVRLALVPVPDGDGAACRDLRDAEHSATRRTHRGSRSDAAAGNRSPSGLHHPQVVRCPRGRGGLSVFGGIETGGSKWRFAVGTGPDDVRAAETIPTTTPTETIDLAVEFFERAGPVDAVGIGSFGPVDRNVMSPTWGQITSTPKPGWAHTVVAPEIRRRLSVPVRRRHGRRQAPPRSRSSRIRPRPHPARSGP